MNGSMTREEFEVLVYIESIGTVQAMELEEHITKIGINKNVVCELLERGKIECFNGGYSVTDIAIEELEKYRVKRAVILAAGYGSRMNPITLTVPKPLVSVNGVRIIDTIIKALKAVDIHDIWIVRGYLSEKFEDLLVDYPDLKFIENNEYMTANNISSVYCAKEYLSNAYVLEADLVVNNPTVIRKYEYCTNYIGRYCEHTDDWCFVVENGVINELNIKGDNVFHMYGISYWTNDDGVSLAECIEKVYNSEDGKQKYWDEVPLRMFKDEFQIEVRPCYNNDIVEIDTFEELMEIDSSYKK